MNKNVQAVTDWRIRNKQRMVDAFGGKCASCGYCKTNRALQFHHIDPSEKDFEFGRARASCLAWPSLVEELRKCIMLCANCHMEVHDGVTNCPTEPRFDESFAEFKKLPTPKKSPSDYHPKPSKWEGFDVIELRKTMTNQAVANLIGVSETAVRKRISKLTT